MRAKTLSPLLLFLLIFQVLVPVMKTYSLPVQGSAATSDDEWIIDISVTVEVRCKFEIHNGRLWINLGDQLKGLVEVMVGSAQLPSVLRSTERASAGLRTKIPRSAKVARLDLPVALDFETPDSLGGYHYLSISQDAKIDIPPEKRTVDMLFSLDETNCVKKLEWRDPSGRTQPKDEPVSYVPFVVQRMLEVATPSAERVDVLVASSIWSSVQTSVNQYASDLSSAYSVYVYSVTYGTPEQVRSYLQGHLTLGLKGCLLVGDIPYALYYIPPHDVWDTVAFPCDLFYMDLNGVWTDANSDGQYDGHSGDVAPEIWVGRIKPTGMGDQATLTNNYFNKNHAFRTSAMSVPRRALVYVDDDWTEMADGVDSSMGKIYSDTTKIKDPATTTASDYVSRLALGYEWVHLQCHGWPGGHVFKIPGGGSGGTVYSTDYATLDPQVLFYQFFVCSGARFSVDDYLAGVAVFKTSYGLLAIGSTKTGSMLYFEDFYTLVATSKDIGTAFRTWFVTYGETSRDWFYGLTIIGDPTLTPVQGGPYEELAYDDGGAEFGFRSAVGSVAAVKFSVSSEIQLLKLEYYIWGEMNKVMVHVLDASFQSIYSQEVMSSEGWFTVDISMAGIVVRGDFHVGFQWMKDLPPWLGVDTTPPHNRRSYLGWIGAPGPPKENEDYLIRAFAKELPAAEIAFISGSGTSAELYAMRRDGSSLKRLTYNSVPESGPSISGNGQWIAFISGSGTFAELYVMKRDSTSLRRLTYNSVPESSPSIGDDGQWIAFISGSGTSAELYVISRDGISLKRLTYNSVPESGPVISGDGQWIAFISGTGSSAELYVMKPDGTGLKRLTYNSIPESSPSISYDGYWIAFICGDGTSAELYLISRDASTLRRLTYNSVADLYPSISGDGQWISFINNAGSSSELYVIKTDRTGLKRLTYNSVAESSPSISTNGQWIVFIYGSDTSAELYLISRDGMFLKRLTYNSVPESSPSIS